MEWNRIIPWDTSESSNAGLLSMLEDAFEIIRDSIDNEKITNTCLRNLEHAREMTAESKDAITELIVLRRKLHEKSKILQYQKHAKREYVSTQKLLINQLVNFSEIMREHLTLAEKIGIEGEGEEEEEPVERESKKPKKVGYVDADEKVHIHPEHQEETFEYSADI